MARGRTKQKDCSACDKKEPVLMQAAAPIVALFNACETQWRRDFGMAYGLDYPAVYRVAESLGISINRVVFMGLQELEHLTLAKWREGRSNG